ncbi:hypothetical protein LEP1GSC132_2051 [Leptospira kirschneri str. 200803703]|nr:hypothetical protein LEP1GSC044_3560 [Leptospira kirschneri serovar Grippotyphosa str. RM52]EKQ85194.1 hypothetical protein LEP1GSC064_1592 [Leptospira kirschneri serovar Grippotyphosa str. Moskva]EKR06683.1 hypothetical protein LEP1GSC122_0988 [Leptospira kirschneri serovar Valbuzzi str. 200702274]EMK02380.1 hypothetical protein LEP1GSC176_3217 [Leptospira kirschneri str. MMD1493]EMK19468.1 hypothetical protein LEP1GSC042_1582 [Leptospira kirschneri serovar Bim str. PUO 1247]EMN05339.1 hyp
MIFKENFRLGVCCQISKSYWMGLAAYLWTAFWGKFFSKKYNSGEFPQI